MNLHFRYFIFKMAPLLCFAVSSISDIQFTIYIFLKKPEQIKLINQYISSQCTMGKQVVNKTTISHTVHYGKASGTQLLHKQCTMGKQVLHSYLIYRALLASKWYAAIQYTVHYRQAGDTQLFKIQCTMAKQVIHSYLLYSALWAKYIFSSFLRTFEELVKLTLKIFKKHF